MADFCCFFYFELLATLAIIHIVMDGLRGYSKFVFQSCYKVSFIASKVRWRVMRELLCNVLTRFEDTKLAFVLALSRPKSDLKVLISSSYPSTCTHMHTYIHVHTYMHTFIRTFTHTCVYMWWPNCWHVFLWTGVCLHGFRLCMVCTCSACLC